MFSVIIPTYNRSNEVVHAVRSVLDQNHTDFEVIVVDDGSTDNTIDILSNQFSDARLQIASIPHIGRSGARNHGLENAYGNWICFLDSDDEYMPGVLEAFQHQIKSNPDFLAFACEQTFNHEPRKHTSGSFTKDGYVFRFEDFICHNPISLNQLCFCSEVKCRFPKEELENAEDWYFFRVLSSSAPVFKFNFVGVNVNDHQQRSVYTTDSQKFAVDNLKSAELVVRQLQLSKAKRSKLLLYTNLLCANVVLSGSHDKKTAMRYFKKTLKIRALGYKLFYSALIKFFIY